MRKLLDSSCRKKKMCAEERQYRVIVKFKIFVALFLSIVFFSIGIWNFFFSIFYCLHTVRRKKVRHIGVEKGFALTWHAALALPGTEAKKSIY